MKAETIIIQHSERQSMAQRAVFAAVAVFAWLFWAFLWLPLLTLGAWALGLRNAWLQLHVLNPIGNSGDINIILVVAVLCAAVFSSWSGYNHARFAGKQKRRGNNPVDVAETAAAIGATIGDALKMQGHRRTVVSVAQDGFMTVDESR